MTDCLGDGTSKFISMINYSRNSRVQATQSSHLSFDAVTQRVNQDGEREAKGIWERFVIIFDLCRLMPVLSFIEERRKFYIFRGCLQIGGEDTNITFEDQQQINTFARKSAKLQELKDEIEEKKV